MLVFLESLILTNIVVQFISSQKFFTPPLGLMISVVILLALLITTNALLAGAWGRWEQFVFGPLAICLGIFLVVYPINSAYAVVIFFVVYVLTSYEIILASQLKKQMLIFNPRLVLKFVSKGIILSFSLSAAILVIVTAGKQPEINIGDRVGEFVDTHLTKQLNSQINSNVNTQLQEGLTSEQMERLSAFGLDPSKFEYYEYAEPSMLENLPNIPTPKLSLKSTVAKEVNKLVEPYEKLVNPIMAALVFGLIQFLGVIAYLFYSLTIDLVFWGARRFNLLKIEKIPAEQEILHF